MNLNLVAEVDSVQTVLSLVARGVADAVVPESAVRAWIYPQALHMSTLVSPAIRNRLVLGVPKARPSTQLTRFARQLLKDLISRHFDAPGVQRMPGQG